MTHSLTLIPGAMRFPTVSLDRVPLRNSWCFGATSFIRACRGTSSVLAPLPAAPLSNPFAEYAGQGKTRHSFILTRTPLRTPHACRPKSSASNTSWQLLKLRLQSLMRLRSIKLVPPSKKPSGSSGPSSSPDPRSCCVRRRSQTASFFGENF